MQGSEGWGWISVYPTREANSYFCKHRLQAFDQVAQIEIVFGFMDKTVMASRSTLYI